MMQSVTESQFRNAFRDMNRGDSFSYQALSALYVWLEDTYGDMEEDYKLDVIELCCSFSEVTLSELKEQYNMDLEQARNYGTVIEAEDCSFSNRETTYLIEGF